MQVDVVLHAHGGGFIAMSVEVQKKRVGGGGGSWKEFAKNTTQERFWRELPQCDATA